jgi:hypothetical protein
MDADIEKRFTATRSENAGEIIEGIWSSPSDIT